MPKEKKMTKAAKAFAKGEFGAPEDTTPRPKKKINKQVVVKLPTAQERLEEKNDRSIATQLKRAAAKGKKNPPKKVEPRFPNNTATKGALKLAVENGIDIKELDGGIDNRVGIGEVKAAIKAISGE